MYQTKAAAASTAQAAAHRVTTPSMWWAMADTPEQAPGPVRGSGPAPHGLARRFVACKTIAPMIASVIAAPRQSLAMLDSHRGAAGSRPACHRCQHLIRPAGPPAPMLQWVPSPAPAGTSGRALPAATATEPAADGQR